MTDEIHDSVNTAINRELLDSAIETALELVGHEFHTNILHSTVYVLSMADFKEEHNKWYGTAPEIHPFKFKDEPAYFGEIEFILKDNSHATIYLLENPEPILFSQTLHGLGHIFPTKSELTSEICAYVFEVLGTALKYNLTQYTIESTLNPEELCETKHRSASETALKLINVYPDTHQLFSFLNHATPEEINALAS